MNISVIKLKKKYKTRHCYVVNSANRETALSSTEPLQPLWRNSHGPRCLESDKISIQHALLQVNHQSVCASPHEVKHTLVASYPSVHIILSNSWTYRIQPFVSTDVDWQANILPFDVMWTTSGRITFKWDPNVSFFLCSLFHSYYFKELWQIIRTLFNCCPFSVWRWKRPDGRCAFMLVSWRVMTF